MSEMIIFSGTANKVLAEDIAAELRLSLGQANVSRFSDGEIFVEILENVRGKDVFIIQPTCAPTDTHIMELCLMADAIHRSSAFRITAVIPYFGYSRQDRRVRSARVPISAKVTADILESVGINRILTVDLHSEQVQGFFSIPVDNAYGSQVLIDDITKQDCEDLVIVSPDVGGVVRARVFAKLLNDASLSIIDKRRPRVNESIIMNIIGDVEGRDCIIVDDLVDTAGTLCAAGAALKSNGAKKVSAYCTHPVLSGKAVQNVKNSVLTELVVTDSIPLSLVAQECSKIRQLSISKMLAETIARVNQEESISCMFNELF